MLGMTREDFDDFTHHANELVKRWYRKNQLTHRSTLECYVDRDIDILFEYATIGDASDYPFVQCERLASPFNDAARNSDEIAHYHASPEVRYFLSNFRERGVQNITNGKQVGMFLGVVQSANEIEQLIPARFSVRRKRYDVINE
jgi:hypothetical protein